MQSIQSAQYVKTLVDPKYKTILEFGVYEGYSLLFIRESFDESYKIFGFDSFEGLPEDWINTHLAKGSFSTGGVAPDIKNVKFYKGWFEDTIPEFLESENVEDIKSIGLIHFDCDLYSSTKTIFKYLHPYIKSGTILAFDEWCYNLDPQFNDHEQKAFYEYVEEYDVNYEFVDYNDNPDPKKIETKIVKIL